MNSRKPLGRRIPVLDLIAGNVCLDFINTLDDRPSDKPKELLSDYCDLAQFGEQTGLLTPAQADYFFEKTPGMPDEAEATLRRARALREALYAIFSAVMDRRAAPQAAMDTLNANLHDAAQHSRLVQRAGRCEWRYDDPASSFNSVLWPIARAAASLLASDQLLLVRACSSPTCQWLFLDTSKNHRRRWCDMTKCGNRAKVRSFYERKRAHHKSTETRRKS